MISFNTLADLVHQEYVKNGILITEIEMSEFQIDTLLGDIKALRMYDKDYDSTKMYGDKNSLSFHHSLGKLELRQFNHDEIIKIQQELKELDKIKDETSLKILELHKKLCDLRNK